MRILGFRCCLVLVVLLLAGAGAMTYAQTTRGAYRDVRDMPTGPAGEAIRAVLDAVNANDAQRVRALVNERFSDQFRNAVPIEEHQAVFAEASARERGLDFYGIRRYENEADNRAGEYVVIARGRLTGAWRAIVLTLDPAPPHRITGIEFAPARPPTDLPAAPKLSDQEVVTELGAFLERLVDAEAFSGTVLLARNGNVLFREAYGLACKRYDAPNKIDTKFNLGSMNKMFTSVAVMQLVERGKISIDDPLSKFVSTDWLPQEVTEKIQIKHLLTHTSGLGSYFNERYERLSKARFRELDDYKPLVSGESLAFEPGTAWRYSNTGMFMLGVVIEKATGQSYFDYVRENVYKPAGMINSDCYDMDEPVPNLAMGYTKRDGKWKNNLYMHVIRGGPAGGGFSTVDDLLRFDQALRSHKLLSPESTEIIWSPKPEMNSPAYGFGFGIEGRPGDRIVGHGGGFPGISAKLDMYLDSGYTVAVLSNYDQGASVVAEKLREWLSAR